MNNFPQHIERHSIEELAHFLNNFEYDPDMIDIQILGFFERKIAREARKNKVEYWPAIMHYNDSVIEDGFHKNSNDPEDREYAVQASSGQKFYFSLCKFDEAFLGFVASVQYAEAMSEKVKIDEAAPIYVYADDLD